MKFLQIHIILVVLIVFGCSVNPDRNDNCDIVIKNANLYLDQYYASSDTSVFDSILECMDNKSFFSHASDKEYFQTISRILLIKGAYKELEFLINSAKWLEPYAAFNLPNYVQFKKLKSQGNNLSISFIEKSLMVIEDSLAANPQDSLKLIDYYCFKSLLNGKSATIREIDSVYGKDEKFSLEFVNYVLKDAVSEFDN